MFLKQLDHVARRDENHKKYEQNKAGGVDGALVFGSDRRAFERFKQKKNRPPAVQSGKRKSVDDAEVDGQNRRELNEISEAQLSHLISEDANTHRSGHLG